MTSGWFDRFLRPIGIAPRHVRLILVIFCVSFIARAGILYPGFAIDDYAVSFGSISATYPTFISQGRFLHAAIVGAIDAIGVNVADVYIAFGALALILQAAFIVSILRFVGVDELAGAWLVGSLIAVHPYATEVLTFRMALPGYCAATLFSIIALEMVIRYPMQLAARLWAVVSLLAMVFTYQVFINYIGVAILFAWIVGEVSSEDRRSVFRERAILLATLGVSAIAVFVSVMWVLSLTGAVSTEARTHLITLEMVPQRLLEIAGSLKRIYWQAEPTLPAWLKIAMWILIGFSVIKIAGHHWRADRKDDQLKRSILLVLPAVMLVPLSLGSIIFFQGWWPVPRAVGHSAVIIGLVFLVGDYCATGSTSPLVGRIQKLGRGLLVFAFVLISNQIFADQHKLNQWDLSAATRLVARMEALPGFKDVKYVHVRGGWWGYPSGIRTAGGNLNMSALWETWSKAELLVAASGYQLRAAKGEREAIGDSYCETASAWPESGSIKVEGDLAIICLKK